MVKITIGNNIKNARRQAGYSQRDLAKLMDTTFQNISSWECDRTQPDIDTLKKLAQVLNTKLEMLCPVQMGWQGPSVDDSPIIKIQNLTRIIDCYDLSGENKAFIVSIIQNDETVTRLRKMLELMEGGK